MGNLYGVIGCPINHSMSPDIHNDAFKDKNIDGYYHAFHVEPDQLGESVQALKVLGVKGFNVTIPHKISIIPYMDELDVTAKIAGAVNTVVNVNGRLVGHNTDGNGYVDSLTHVLIKPIIEQKILIIGAGGAARGIYFTLAHQGCQDIDLCNRTISKAEELIMECPYENTSKALTLEEAELQLESYDVIIQTTAVGLHPNIDQKPLSLNNAKQSVVVSDIVYNPIKTALLQEAEERGLTIHNGVGMFVHQAALAFNLWTGLEPSIEKMTEIVYDKLGGTSC
ncbi:MULTISPECIES: shikimate dehydrogenase [Metabacillus]|jgi:shikimate dehydrogenase|uniref:Shikimate dehydrogenase (NADP(+)) n=3 Tax=Metabacillus TaxID=2675233 RepID=A0A179SVW5_9BACI|nr:MULTISPECIES: shikimate dehydrogenase [Metabacillus]OAS84999.1 shikimate dehydrogenase [Metabacillus litoralis]QNF26310.1 shikimate dehydrogenase [Metabacillus sp. KUDC1714]